VPFLFPKTQLGSPLEEIARIKRQIEARIGTELNVKLGSGAFATSSSSYKRSSS